ncbi:MAG: hypothetical protein AAF135_05220 [Bacteroidota bacterium]
MDTMDQLMKTIRELVGEDEMQQAIHLLEDRIPPKNGETLNQIAQLKREFNRLIRREVLNSIAEEQLSMRMNDFTDRFLKFVTSLTDEDLTHEEDLIHEESMPQVHSHSVNTDFRLAVISARKPAALKIQRLFKLAGIQPVDLFYHPVDWTAVDLHPYTLVIFDNQDLAECPKEHMLAKLSQEEQELILARIEEMETYLSMYEDKFILHFGDFLYWINQTRDRVHPANSKFSLYARTMEALDFIQAFQV